MIRLGNRYIGGDKPCFIVAEAGLSHLGSLDRAKEIVDAAVGCGAEAIKFQAYKTVELIAKDRAPLPSVEGFVRQILGWRDIPELNQRLDTDLHLRLPASGSARCIPRWSRTGPDNAMYAAWILFPPKSWATWTIQ